MDSKRKSPEILLRLYRQTARYWVKGLKVKDIAAELGVSEQEVYRYKRTRQCKQYIEELGGSFYRRALGYPKKVQLAQEKCKEASELSFKYKDQGLSNIEILRSLARDLNVDIATIYCYLKRKDWAGVKGLAKKINRKL